MAINNGVPDEFEDEREATFTRIVCNPAILGGKPTIRGHRISVQFVLERLASGETIDSFAKLYSLDRDDVKQSVQFAAARMGCGAGLPEPATS